MAAPKRTERRTIALLIQQPESEYQSSIWRGMHEFSVSRGLDLFILDGRSIPRSDSDGQETGGVFDLVNSPRIHGVIDSDSCYFNSPSPRRSEETRKMFGNKPVVNLSNANPELPCVLVDNRAGIREAIAHLAVFHGRKRIAFLRGPESNFDAEDRFAGYRQSLADFHLPFDPSLAFPGDFNASSGRILAEALSRGAVPSFDALVAANDKMAIGFLQAAEKFGIRVPEDVSLTGFDDDREAANLTRPLSTVQQPLALLCSRAGDMLVSLMDGEAVPPNAVLKPRFIIRESCGCHSTSKIRRFDADSHGRDLYRFLPVKKPGGADTLFGILESEARQTAMDGTFCAALYDIVSSSAAEADWAETLRSMREQIPFSGDDTAFHYRLENLLQDGLLLIAEVNRRKYNRDILSLRNSLVIMNDFSRDARGMNSENSLSEALDRALMEIRINFTAISLSSGKAEDGALSQYSSLRYLYRNGANESLSGDPVTFPTLSILPDGAMPSDSPMVCIVMPLVDSGNFLGFVFFDFSLPDASVYELLRSQISSILGRARLMVELVEKETLERVEIEKMHSLGTLVAGIAHEINTPVGIGVTAASHLDRLFADLAGDFTAGLISRSGLEEFIRDGIETGRLLISNLERAASLVSSFKKVAVDSSSETRRFFRVKEYINDILITLSPRLKRTGIRIDIDCPEDLELDSYPGAFSQILSNLVVNSLVHGFAGDGGGEDGKAEIRMRFSLVNEVLVWMYQDNGKGMEKDIAQRAFEPFFTTARESGGSGLGLHIVYNTVTAVFGGRITLSSAPGKGAKFTITIPVKSEEMRYVKKT